MHGFRADNNSLLVQQAVQVNVGNGIVYSKKHNISDAAPHMFGTHSAPWFLFEAIKSSKYYTTASPSQAPLAPGSLCHRATAAEIDQVKPSNLQITGICANVVSLELFPLHHVGLPESQTPRLHVAKFFSSYSARHAVLRFLLTNPNYGGNEGDEVGDATFHWLNPK